jgi:hypothetical protein
MNRQTALNIIWKRLALLLILFSAIAIFAKNFGGALAVPSLVLLLGNMGAYVSVHRSLKNLTDQEVIGLAASWNSIVVPSLVGGVLAFVLYFLFLSEIVAGDLFPKFVPDDKVSPLPQSIAMLDFQHAKDAHEYAKFFFWSFAAGFNQERAVGIIESVRSKPDV